MADELNIWALGEGHAAEAVESVASVELENIVEETLVTRPEMLEPELQLVGRQLPTAGGPLDLLGVDREGRLVVFELKRGSLTRDAVTQIVDYGSWLAAQDISELTNHIADRSGQSGIDPIPNFQEWYEEKFPEKELRDLRPPRLMLVGLGVDERAERMASFLRDEGVGISVLTFYGFQHDGQTLLARQVEVAAPASTPNTTTTYKTADQKRREFQERLLRHGLDDLFKRVDPALRTSFPGTTQLAGSYGFTYSLPADPGPRGFYRVAVDDAKGSLQIHWIHQEDIYAAETSAKLKAEAEVDDWEPQIDRHILDIGNDEKLRQVLQFLSAARAAWNSAAAEDGAADEPTS